MYIQLEDSDYKTAAERIFESIHDYGTVYITCGDVDVAVKYEKHVVYDGWYNTDGTRDVLCCDLSILDVSYTASFIDIEYDEDKFADAFSEIVNRV